MPNKPTKKEPEKWKMCKCKVFGGYTEGYICRICHKHIYTKEQGEEVDREREAGRVMTTMSYKNSPSPVAEEWDVSGLSPVEWCIRWVNNIICETSINNMSTYEAQEKAEKVIRTLLAEKEKEAYGKGFGAGVADGFEKGWRDGVNDGRIASKKEYSP